jgi:hypothetical protein
MATTNLLILLALLFAWAIISQSYTVLRSNIHNSHLSFHTRLHGDRGDALHLVCGRVEVQKAFVQPQLILVPCVGAFTAR